MKNLKALKRFISMAMITTVCCLPLSVCAKESSAEQLPSQEVIEAEAYGNADEGIEPQALGNILATSITTINGGSGRLTVTLPSGNWFADLVAGIAYTDQAGVVSCSVLAPDGKTYNLGNIAGTGSRTNAYQLTYAPAGDYTYYFSSAITTPFRVSAFIYD